LTKLNGGIKMVKEADFVFYPEELFNEEHILKSLSERFDIPKEEINSYRVIRKSIDARKKVKYNVRIQCISASETFPELAGKFEFRDVFKSKPVLIVGAGPAGYFAALNCLLLGIKPIIIERGKSVEERKYDISQINRGLNLNPESNYAFGEGGAGTYSDGKLYTRSKKRGDVFQILQLLHYFGADDDILINSHPHVGTDKLPGIMKNIREKIINSGGEIYFNSKVTKLILNKNLIKGVECEDGKTVSSDFVILATGHSARDVYYFLDNQKVMLTEKGFAMGIRVEHPQNLIDGIQYKRKERGEFLPPASYNLVKQVDNRGVYSFCMCPGGTIVCSATEKNQIVVNGMSNSKRNSAYANSGIVVELQVRDLIAHSEFGTFAGLELQKQLENMAFVNSALGLKAPAQRLSDFVAGKISQNLPTSSYHPGLISSPLHFWLPDIISLKLRKAFKEFDKQMRGFITNQAIVVGVESRTSSPIQILRNPETFQSVNIEGLFPCGEGAGYAGGIVSSAIDGMIAVNKISEVIK